MGSLSLNDETDYGLCFACGPRNASGLRLRFEQDGDGVRTAFRGRPEHQGFPGQVHGAVITALLDEVMSRVSLLEDRWTMTARIQVRFRRPVPLDQEVTAIGRKTRTRGGLWEARGSVRLPDGDVAAEASGTFVDVPEETLARMTEGYPRLAAEWMRPG